MPNYGPIFYWSELWSQYCSRAYVFQIMSKLLKTILLQLFFFIKVFIRNSADDTQRSARYYWTYLIESEILMSWI